MIDYTKGMFLNLTQSVKVCQSDMRHPVAKQGSEFEKYLLVHSVLTFNEDRPHVYYMDIL